MWCDRIEKNPENNIRVWNGWDASVYNSSSYTQLLTEILIDNVIMQSEFAEQELSFSADELIPLLKRAQVIGQRIYELEPPVQIWDLVIPYFSPSPVLYGLKIVVILFLCVFTMINQNSFVPL